MYYRKSLTAAAVVAAGISLVSAPARADGADDSFLQALDGRGVQYGTMDRAISVAQNDVCGQLAGNPSTSMNDLVTVVASDANLSMADSSFFTGSAIAAYCPQYQSVVNAPSMPAGDPMPTPVPGGPMNVPIS
jgi:Protein of unknown function (DUF732)